MKQDPAESVPSNKLRGNVTRVEMQFGKFFDNCS